MVLTVLKSRDSFTTKRRLTKKGKSHGLAIAGWITMYQLWNVKCNFYTLSNANTWSVRWFQWATAICFHEEIVLSRNLSCPGPNDRKWATTCDFQQCGIFTWIDSDEPVQPRFKLRNSKCCSVSSWIFIEYSSHKQRLWSDCEYAQTSLSLYWSHIPHCLKSHVAAQLFDVQHTLDKAPRLYFFMLNSIQHEINHGDKC